MVSRVEDYARILTLKPRKTLQGPFKLALVDYGHLEYNVELESVDLRCSKINESKVQRN